MFKFIANLFAEETPVVAPAAVNWNTRLKAAEARIDNALLRNHGKEVPLVAKADIAARLRAQIKESCARHADSVAATVERSIRSFERAGVC